MLVVIIKNLRGNRVRIPNKSVTVYEALASKSDTSTFAILRQPERKG